MMRLAKNIGRVTCTAAALTSLSLSSSVGMASRRRRIASVTTIAPSTRMPKSIAPSDSRLADTCVRLSSENTATSASGMVTPGNQCAARTAEEEDQDQKHQRDALEDGAADLVHGRAHQVVAIDVGHDAHILLGELAVELRDLGVDALEGFRGVLVLQHQHDAFDRVGIVVLAENALALLVT